MSLLRLEVSDPQFTPAHTRYISIHSGHLGGRHDVSVYNADTTQRNIPVVIFLHGVYGNHWVWMNLGGVHKVYKQLRAEGLEEFLLVMPSDGGLLDGSAYLPLADKGNYEQWIMDDVVNAIKTLHPSQVTDKSRWYISGLSMGGYGALRLGAKYPECFSGVSAHSSITQLDDMTQFVETPLSFYRCEEPREADLLHWFDKTTDTRPALRFDCGTDDSLIDANRWLHQQLIARKISHEYQEYAGTHEWAYWHEHVAESFKWFSAIEKRHKSAV